MRHLDGEVEPHIVRRRANDLVNAISHALMWDAQTIDSVLSDSRLQWELRQPTLDAYGLIHSMERVCVVQEVPFRLDAYSMLNLSKWIECVP